MRRIKQWIDRHSNLISVLILISVFVIWWFGDIYYVRHKLIYQRYVEMPYDDVSFTYWNIEYFLEKINSCPEVEEILKEYDKEKYDLLMVFGGELRSLILSHDDVYYYHINYKPVRNPYVISYYIIPNVYFFKSLYD